MDQPFNTIQEICDIIADINLELEEKNGVSIYGLSFHCIPPYEMHIRFLDVTIWEAEDDPREYNKITEEYEDLEIYLKHQVNSLIEMLIRDIRALN